MAVRRLGSDFLFVPTALDRHSGSLTRLCPYQREIADAISDPEIEQDVLTAVLTKTPNVRADRMAHLAPPGSEKFLWGIGT
jgi:hypothetical protein